MPELPDWKDEEFCRLVACRMSAAQAYRQAYKPGRLNVELGTLYTMGSRKAGLFESRITELKDAVRGLSEDEWKMGIDELLAFLTRVVRTPLSEIDEDSDLAQEVKEVTDAFGGVTKTTKAINKLGAAQQYAAIRGFTTPAIGQLHLHNHQSTPAVDSAAMAARLAERFALPAPQATVIEAEVVPVKTRRKQTI